MKSGTDLEETTHSSAQPDLSTRRFGDATEDLEQGARTRAISPNDADHLALLDFEADVLERPDLLNFITLHDLPAGDQVGCLPNEVAGLAAHDITQGRVSLTLNGLMSNQI